MDETGRKKEARVREPPQVPFLWEIKPGIPNRDWKPQPSSSSSALPQISKIPVKLVASVPFAWEEKPGIPIPHFSLQSASPNPEAKITDTASSSSSSSSSSSVGFFVACKESSSDYEDGGDSDIIGMEAYESFGSEPSLLENCLVPSAKVSTAIPLQKNYLTEQNSKLLEGSSPGSSGTSSYETGRSSLVGVSFLESLFPLYPPTSGFIEKDGFSENVSSTPLEVKSRDFDGEDNSSFMVRRPPTLGELIMMSRRRSYRRKAVQMKKWDLQRNMTAKEAFGCCMFASNSKMIEGFFKRKHLPTLKLL